MPHCSTAPVCVCIPLAKLLLFKQSFLFTKLTLDVNRFMRLRCACLCVCVCFQGYVQTTPDGGFEAECSDFGGVKGGRRDYENENSFGRSFSVPGACSGEGKDILFTVRFW